MHNVLIRPVITEKSMKEAGKGKYTFVVARSADKEAIKKIIEKTFSVHVQGIITSTVKGKTKRTGQRRIEVTISPLKKATVTLKAGEKIGLFETTVS